MREHEIELDYGTEKIYGTILVTRRPTAVHEMVGVVLVDSWPTDLAEDDARVALKCAVLDGRIKLPDADAIALDLVGSKPRVY